MRGVLRHLKRFRVWPLRCNIDFVQMAIAADSLDSLDSLFDPLRTFTVLRTCLIHRQNLAALVIHRAVKKLTVLMCMWCIYIKTNLLHIRCRVLLAKRGWGCIAPTTANVPCGDPPGVRNVAAMVTARLSAGKRLCGRAPVLWKN